MHSKSSNQMKKRDWKEYYSRKKEEGLIKLLGKNIYKLLLTLVVFIASIYSFQQLFPALVDDLADRIHELTPNLIYGVFLLSESIMGILPPDLFILWTQDLQLPFLHVTLLAVLSYVGGIISYFLGGRLSHLRKIESFIEKRLLKYIEDISKWGGLILIIAALFPLPFSPVCMAAGTLRYPYKTFLLYSSFRILRFYIYAVLLFQLF